LPCWAHIKIAACSFLIFKCTPRRLPPFISSPSLLFSAILLSVCAIPREKEELKVGTGHVAGSFGWEKVGKGVSGLLLLTAQRLRPCPLAISMCSLLLLLLFSLLSAAFPSARCVWSGQPANALTPTLLTHTCRYSHKHTHGSRNKHIPHPNPPKIHIHMLHKLTGDA